MFFVMHHPPPPSPNSKSPSPHSNHNVFHVKPYETSHRFSVIYEGNTAASSFAHRVAGVYSVLAVNLKGLKQRRDAITVVRSAFRRNKAVRGLERRLVLQRRQLQLRRDTCVAEEAAAAHYLEPCNARKPRVSKHPATEVKLHRRPSPGCFIRLIRQGKQKRLSKNFHVCRRNTVPVSVRPSVDSLQQTVKRERASHRSTTSHQRSSRSSHC